MALAPGGHQLQLVGNALEDVTEPEGLAVVTP